MPGLPVSISVSLGLGVWDLGWVGRACGQWTLLCGAGDAGLFGSVTASKRGRVVTLAAASLRISPPLLEPSGGHEIIHTNSGWAAWGPLQGCQPVSTVPSPPGLGVCGLFPSKGP